MSRVVAWYAHRSLTASNTVAEDVASVGSDGDRMIRLAVTAVENESQSAPAVVLARGGAAFGGRKSLK